MARQRNDHRSSSSPAEPVRRLRDLEATDEEVSEALEWRFGGEGSGLRRQGAKLRARALARQLRDDIPPDFAGAIAISGPVGAQKRDLARLLEKDLDWKRASFGDYVRKLALGRGLRTTRPILQDLGEQQIHGLGYDGFASAVLDEAGVIRGREPVIVDGVRHIGIREALAAMFDPLLLLYIDAPTRVRRSRIREEEHLGFAPWKVREIEHHPTEHDLSDLRGIANKRIAGDDLDVAHLEALRALDRMIAS